MNRCVFTSGITFGDALTENFDFKIFLNPPLAPNPASVLQMIQNATFESVRGRNKRESKAVARDLIACCSSSHSFVKC